MKTFIRVVEAWVPSSDRSMLEYGGGLYGEATRFAEVSRSMCFGFGEGLPGAAWRQRRPIVLKNFEGSYFKRTKAAHAEGLTSGIAVPIFAGEFLTSVLVLFCGEDDAHAGAIELWRNDATEDPDMQLADGHYGRTAEAFEYVSRRTSFRKGNGLPGLAWGSGLPVFMEDLGRGSRFLRAETATRVGINRAFAIPCPVPGTESYVVAFLSALGTPIVRRFESWEPDSTRQRLMRSTGFCEVDGALAPSAGATQPERGQGTIGRAFLTGAPAFSDNAGSEPDSIGTSAAAAGLASLAALPILRDGRLVAVVAWYF
ncbi:MAG: GAF domain-containing protein [Burkholderiales bacterium]|nr:GAF domain-containing protein [Burkholderiales bacterium]